MNTLTQLKQNQANMQMQQNVKVDMFSLQGFELAQRVAKCLASSNAVPAQFQTLIEKRDGKGFTMQENKAAIGNCLVAMEVAQAVGMSVASVMQSADIIEGKLRWSAKFVIAAINASKRFQPLRFDIKNMGKVKAVYKEKAGWNDQTKRFNMIEHEIEVDNIKCTAWTLPVNIQMPPDVGTLDQAKAKNLPVIEGVPVSIEMAVTEGWYAKAGSKWQTMPELMLQYRAGTFFGNIHAPDVIMGMGRTVEEERDIVELVETEEGVFTAKQPTTSSDFKNKAKPKQPEPTQEVEVPEPSTQNDSQNDNNQMSFE